MLAISEVIKAVQRKIEKNVHDVYITSQDISEGFKRPSFFIELDNINISDFMTKLRETNVTVRISYFPRKVNYNQAEMYKTIDMLNEILIEDNIIELENGFVTEVNECDISVVDKVLHFDFDVYLSEEYVRELYNKEKMEDIEINI